MEAVQNSEFDSKPWGELGRSLTLGMVCLSAKLVMTIMNSTVVKNKDLLLELVTKRDTGVGLVTVSNHTSTVDDPMLPGVLLPASFYFKEHRHGQARWVGCAEEMCFRNEFLRQFFMSGKTLPIKRGGGVTQPVMSAMASFLRRGDWVHVFPEGNFLSLPYHRKWSRPGRVSFDGKVHQLKRGIGKLICDSLRPDGTAPIVLPMYHSGMGSVMPKKGRIPRSGNLVTITVGSPVDLSHFTCRCGDENKEQVWSEIAHEIYLALRELEDQSPINRNQE